MSKKCQLEKMKKTPKFPTQRKNRCAICGRPRAYMRKFNMCRICFRKLALAGQLPGVTKSSF